MTLADLRDLGGMNEHALDLGSLVGTAHPARESHVGPSARRAARDHRRKIAGRKPDHRIVRMERGDDDLADVARWDRIAGAGPHDFDKQGLVDDQTLDLFAL